MKEKSEAQKCKETYDKPPKKREPVITEEQEAILDEVKPKTEAEAIAVLAAAGKPVEAKECRTCKHRPKTVCYLLRTVMNPDEGCSQHEA